MEDRSIIAYEHYRAASQRFEYFFAGIIAALCAYISQVYVPAKLGWNTNTLELISLILLFMSFYFSLKRMEKIVLVHRGVHKKLHLAETKGKHMTHMDIAPFINEQTGQVYSIDDINNEIDLINSMIPVLEDEINNVNKTAAKYYFVRNWFFYCGFILYLLSKNFSAYTKVT